VTGVVTSYTTFNHKVFRELGALHHLDSCVSVILLHLGNVAILNCVLSGIIVEIFSDKTLKDWNTHWEIRTEILVKSALSLNCFGGVNKFRVASDLSSSEVAFIYIAVGVWVNVVLSIVEESIGVIGICASLHIEISPFCLV
jgi:hypothetical protein